MVSWGHNMCKPGLNPIDCKSKSNCQAKSEEDPPQLLFVLISNPLVPLKNAILVCPRIVFALHMAGVIPMVVIQIVRPLLRCGHWPVLDGAHLQSSSRCAGLGCWLVSWCQCVLVTRPGNTRPRPLPSSTTMTCRDIVQVSF